MSYIKPKYHSVDKICGPPMDALNYTASGVK